MSCLPPFSATPREGRLVKHFEGIVPAGGSVGWARFGGLLSGQRRQLPSGVWACSAQCRFPRPFELWQDVLSPEPLGD